MLVAIKEFQKYRKHNILVSKLCMKETSCQNIKQANYIQTM